jgi:hypothetical protein
MEAEIMSKVIDNGIVSADGVDRRGILQCMAWAGTGMLWAMQGGVAFSQETRRGDIEHYGLSFVQISDSHIGSTSPLMRTSPALSRRRWRASINCPNGRNF